MRTRVRRWGNSLGVRIPKGVAEEAGVEQGSEVDVTAERGRIVMRPLRPRRYTLEELVREITPQNRHPEIDWGSPRGREVW